MCCQIFIILYSTAKTFHGSIKIFITNLFRYLFSVVIRWIGASGLHLVNGWKTFYNFGFPYCHRVFMWIAWPFLICVFETVYFKNYRRMSPWILLRRSPVHRQERVLGQQRSRPLPGHLHQQRGKLHLLVWGKAPDSSPHPPWTSLAK